MKQELRKGYPWVTERRKCKQNLRLEVKILDTPFSSKICNMSAQQLVREYKTYWETLCPPQTGPRVMMITLREHLSPWRGRRSFSIQQKMELKQRECEMRRPASNSKQRLNRTYKQIFQVSGQYPLPEKVFYKALKRKICRLLNRKDIPTGLRKKVREDALETPFPKLSSGTSLSPCICKNIWIPGKKQPWTGCTRIKESLISHSVTLTYPLMIAMHGF